MNAIRVALNDIHNFDIPREVLDLAFMNRNVTENTSLDHRITNKVIKSKVLIDSNLRAGIAGYIPLSEATIISDDIYGVVISIPDRVTNGKRILSAVSILEYDDTNLYGSRRGFTNNSLLNGLTRMVNSISNDMYSVMETELEVINDNVIYIGLDSEIDLSCLVMKVFVEHDMSSFSNLNARQVVAFSKLCSLATKAYVYNKLRVSLSKGYISGGHSIDIVQEIINEFSESKRDYDLFLEEEWGKVMFMGDEVRMTNFVSLLVGNL